MIRLLLVLCFAISPVELWADSSNLKYFRNGTYVDVKIIRVGKSKVSANCKNSMCQALKVANGNSLKSKISGAPFTGNPGANYCWDVGAKSKILEDQKNNQYDFCEFPDGSMIDAWNLYSKHYPTQRVK